MKWESLPPELQRLIWHHRSMLMASAFLDSMDSTHMFFPGGDRLTKVHAAYRVMKHDPHYKNKALCLLKDHDIWVHYYAS